MGENRKLAAIMAVDVVGYSRLMSEDEAGTAKAVREHRRAAVPIVAGLGGRVVKTMGDGLLLEFPSIVAAVECAVTIQNMMLERNLGTPEARRITYRIGVHLGDVLIDGDDILGEGVNIAARLESICEPGGVSVSRAVYDQISGKLALGFRTLGLQKLKNIAKPVEVFAIDYLDKADDAHTPDDANVAQMVRSCRRAGRSTPRLRDFAQRAAIGEVRKLAEPSGIRLGKPDLAACPSRAVALPYANSLRRERQRHVPTGMLTRSRSTPG